MKRFLKPIIIGVSVLLTAFFLFSIANGTAPGEPQPAPPIPCEYLKGFVVNWTKKHVAISISPKPHVPFMRYDCTRTYIISLAPVQSMGKGDYQYHPPNVYRLELTPGEYKVCYGYDGEGSKCDDVFISPYMPQPFELDIEP